MTMTEMLALGAPVLPSGYFYRVGLGGFGYHKLTIRRKRWLGSAEISSCVFHVDDHGSEKPEEVLRAAAENAFDKWEYKKESMARHSAMDKWMGDHK